MPRSNFKLLTHDELQYFKDNYIFKFQNGLVLVKTTNYDRTVVHDADKQFTINSKVRRITITPDSINIWKQYFQGNSLVEIQNAVNALQMSYQEVNASTVKQQLALINKQ